MKSSFAFFRRGLERRDRLLHLLDRQGSNAPDLEKCIELLKNSRREGVFSIKTLGTEENIRERVAWLRKKIAQGTAGSWRAVRGARAMEG